LRRTSRLLVVFGIGLAVLTFVLVVALLGNNGGSGSTPTATPVQNVTVVVAAQDIPLGTTVTADMLSTQTVPVDAAAAGAFQVTSQAVGQIARQAILTGEQIGASQFSTEQTGISVPPGKRAIAIEVSELTGVGKLVFPGDYVDLVVTLDENAIKIVTVSPPAKSPYVHDDALRPVTVKAPVLLQNVQVLGTIDSPGSAPATNQQPEASGSPAPNEPTLTGTNKLIILAVDENQAEAILFARDTGTIDLLLRSAADASAPPITTGGVDLKTMFDKYGVLPPYLIKAIDAYIPQQP